MEMSQMLLVWRALLQHLSWPGEQLESAHCSILSLMTLSPKQQRKDLMASSPLVPRPAITLATCKQGRAEAG